MGINVARKNNIGRTFQITLLLKPGKKSDNTNQRFPLEYLDSSFATGENALILKNNKQAVSISESVMSNALRRHF